MVLLIKRMYSKITTKIAIFLMSLDDTFYMIKIQVLNVWFWGV